MQIVERLKQPGMSRRDLALAIGLPETASKQTVLTEIERVHNLADPGNQKQKELAERLALIGYSADFEAASITRTLRDKLIAALCDGSDNSRFEFRNVCFRVNELSDSQIVALSAAMLAVRRRRGPSISTLRASAGARPGALPTRMRVLDWGVNHTLKGRIIVDEITAQVFASNQRKCGFERVALDYEHNTVPGSPEYERTQEPREVAAYWTPRVIAGEGIVLEAPTWTPSGERNALNFEDISGAPMLDGERVVGLHSVALTKAGASDFTFLDVPEIPGVTLTAVRPRTLRALAR